MRSVSDKNFGENQNTHFIALSTVFQESCTLWDNVEKYCIAEQATDDRQYGARILHAGYLRLKTHSEYVILLIWCEFDRASSLICGNKMPTRCNRWLLYCRSYCLLNMFRTPLCPSSGAQEYYTVVAACDISCCGFQVVGLVYSWGLCVRFAGCCSSTPDRQLENQSTKYHRQQSPV